LNLLPDPVRGIPVVIVKNARQSARGASHAQVHEVPVGQAFSGVPDIPDAGVGGEEVLDGGFTIINNYPF
jgi:hypothetical protein